MDHDTLELPDGRRIAYRQTEGAGPGIVFLGGFSSDMSGTKAQFLEQHARTKGRGFVRFDYTGHGLSSGAFSDGCVGDWAQDAADVLAELTRGAQVLVGSSMGGWIALLLALRMPERIAGLVGVAAAPDFTEDSMWAGFDAAQRAKLSERGRVEIPSHYSDEPDVITLRLIDDGRRNLVLRTPLPLPFPVRLLHGTEDADVVVGVPLRLIGHATGPDIRLTLVKGADHRFSESNNLALIARSIEDVG